MDTPSVAHHRRPRTGGQSQLLAAVLLATAMMSAACAAPAAQAGAPPPAEITAAKAIDREITDWDEFTGRLEAVHHVEVRPRVSGLIASVHFDEGALVNRGDLLFRIDPRPFAAEVDRLSAELVRARAAAARSVAERDRAMRLAAEDAISAEEHDRRVSAAEEAAAQVNAVQATLRAAELNLEFTSVTAPISGRVGQAIVTEGNLVSSGPAAPTLLTTVVSLDPIYAAFEADEQTFLSLAHRAGGGRTRGSQVAVKMALAGEADFPRDGRLDFLDNQLDPATGTIRVRAVFANADGALTPGLFVRLRMPRHGTYAGVLIQDRAVGTDLDKRFVYVVTPDQTIAHRPVTLGPLVDGLRVVRSGVAADELVVINGLQRVRPGSKVKPVVAAMEISR